MMIRGCTLALALFLPLLTASLSAAQDDHEPLAPLYDVGDDEAEEAATPKKENGWSPGLSFELEVFDYGGQGVVDSLVGQSSIGNQLVTINSFQIGLELLSPRVDLSYVKPRFFINGGVEVGPEQPVLVTKEGQFLFRQPIADINAETGICNSDPMNGVLCPPVDRPYLPPSAMSGQGSQVTNLYEGLGWFGGLGVAFQLPGRLSIVDVRTSAKYVGQKTATLAEMISVGGAGPNYIIYDVVRKADEDIHWLGPAIGVDVLTASGGRLDVALFADAQFLFNVGDGTTMTTQPGVATFSTTVEDFRWVLGFGIRFAWKDAFGGK